MFTPYVFIPDYGVSVEGGHFGDDSWEYLFIARHIHAVLSLVLEQHVGQVFVPVDRAVAVRVHLHEDFLELRLFHLISHQLFHRLAEFVNVKSTTAYEKCKISSL